MKNRLKTAFIFPGQGAQYPGMGRDFFQSYSLAREVFEEADDRLENRLSQLIFTGDTETLKETRNSQLAIYVTSLAILKVLQHQFSPWVPFVCAGLSLGEYTALTASQRLSLAEGLSLVHARAHAMHEACLKTQGTMAVVMGLNGEEVLKAVEELRLPQDLWVANFNCPGQVVISGTLKGIEAGSAALLKRGAKRILPLEVSGAFHSGLMRSAEEKLKEPLNQTHFQKSAIALVMNVPGDFVSQEEQIPHYLMQQVTQSVRWEQGVRAMAQAGIELFVEIGPGKTLSGMLKRIGVAAQVVNVETIQDLQKCEAFV